MISAGIMAKIHDYIYLLFYHSLNLAQFKRRVNPLSIANVIGALWLPRGASPPCLTGLGADVDVQGVSIVEHLALATRQVGEAERGGQEARVKGSLAGVDVDGRLVLAIRVRKERAPLHSFRQKAKRQAQSTGGL